MMATAKRTAKKSKSARASAASKAKTIKKPALSQTRAKAGAQKVRPKPTKAAPAKVARRAKAPTKLRPQSNAKKSRVKVSAVKARQSAVEAARKNLKALVSLIEEANDREAEQVLGDGRLEALLRAVLPQRRRSSKTAYDYLASQKRRASLMAQLRHSINTAYSFPTGVEGRFISPTRVQWFYDGLTFLEGSEPFSGVVGLYRNGELFYGLDVNDAQLNMSLGPSESDFVSIEAAKKSFRAAAKPADTGLAELKALQEDEAADANRWVELFERHPWLLGAQHTALVRPEKADANIPRLFAQRVADRAHDVLLVGQPAAPVFGKSGRIQRSFQESLHQAEQTLSFVQRQADYLDREFKLNIRRPRAFVFGGRGLSQSERNTLRSYTEARHAELRVLTFDDLCSLAERTAAFFEPRF